MCGLCVLRSTPPRPAQTARPLQRSRPHRLGGTDPHRASRPSGGGALSRSGGGSSGWRLPPGGARRRRCPRPRRRPSSRRAPVPTPPAQGLELQALPPAGACDQFASTQFRHRTVLLRTLTLASVTTDHLCQEPRAALGFVNPNLENLLTVSRFHIGCGVVRILLGWSESC